MAMLEIKTPNGYIHRVKSTITKKYDDKRTTVRELDPDGNLVSLADDAIVEDINERVGKFGNRMVIESLPAELEYLNRQDIFSFENDVTCTLSASQLYDYLKTADAFNIINEMCLFINEMIIPARDGVSESDRFTNVLLKPKAVDRHTGYCNIEYAGVVNGSLTDGYGRAQYDVSIRFSVFFNNDAKTASIPNSCLLGITLIDTIQYFAPCLMEGTKINMYDGTYKTIETLERGDIVKGYDPETKEIVPTVVLATLKTGYAERYYKYLFTNGKAVDIYGSHGIYDADKGYPVNIETAKLLNTIGVDGKPNTLAHKQMITNYTERPHRRYTLRTSNCTYFANDTLFAYSPFKNYVHFHQVRPESIREDIENLFVSAKTRYEEALAEKTNPEFLAEAAKYYKKIERCNRRISRLKQYLTDTDYVVIKQAEGIKGDDKTDEIHATRASYREKINETETVLSSAKENLERIRGKYRNTKADYSAKGIFEYGAKLFNDNYDAFVSAFPKSEGVKETAEEKDSKKEN